MKLIKPYITLSITISALILLSGGMGMASPEIYEAEAYGWQVQAVWQDYIDVILIMPILMLSGIYAHYKSKAGQYLWAGTLVYLVYTYVIFCFDVHFNQLFLFYCLILGCSFYSLVWFFYENKRRRKEHSPPRKRRHIFIATYFVLLGCGFYFLWLFDIAHALVVGTPPASLENYELFTNPVHVIDLAIILPGFIITGIMIFSKMGPWREIMPVMLVFGALMSFTISSLQVVMYIGNLAASLIVAEVMFGFGILDIILFRLSIPKIPDPAESTQILNFS